MRITHIAAAATIAASLLGSAVQAGMFVYPAKGQSAQKQAEDEGICHQWARQQTGTDPQLIAQANASGDAYRQPEGGFHRLLGGGGRGAALGAIGGAIGGDAGKGAAIGGAVGATMGLFRHRRAVREQAQFNQAVSNEQSARLNEFDQAYSTCLRGKGYTVGG